MKFRRQALKVTASGAGVSGLIDYVYDGREEHRQRGDKKAEVIIHSENLQMPRDANDLGGRRALTNDFDNRGNQYLPHFEYVGMHVLSFTKEDMKHLDKPKLAAQIRDSINIVFKLSR